MVLSQRVPVYKKNHSLIVVYIVGNESEFTIMVLHRQTSFREIKQIRAYNIDSLVGNMGGYMGLFLGYALLNFPSLLLRIVDLLKKKILEGVDDWQMAEDSF